MRNKFRTAVSSTGIPTSVGFTLFEKFLNLVIANNYYPERDSHIGELDRDEITTSELLARHLPKSKVVKVFNAIQAAHIESRRSPGRLA
jgi:predicted dinucleotide-binding enzyme